MRETKAAAKERILMAIAVATSGSPHDNMEKIALSGWCVRTRFNRLVPQFCPTVMCDEMRVTLEAGDIVRCATNPRHPWGISEFVESTDGSTHVLRELGGGQYLNMSNESLDVLCFMPPSELYWGHKYTVYQWASTKAFSERYNPAGDYFKRCGGVEIDGTTLRIWSRPHIWIQDSDSSGYSQPKKFEIEWSESTRLRDIVQGMIDQGFGEDYEKGPDEPGEGMGGCMTFTKESLTKALGRNDLACAIQEAWRT